MPGMWNINQGKLQLCCEWRQLKGLWDLTSKSTSFVIYILPLCNVDGGRGASGFIVCLAGFRSCFSLTLFFTLHSSFFEMGMFILCHHILEFCNLTIVLLRFKAKNLPWVSEDAWICAKCWNSWDFWDRIIAFLAVHRIIVLYHVELWICCYI